MKFRGELQLSGKTATGIEVPDEIVTGLGAGKRPAVRVTLGGYTYRTTIAPMGGSYWIGVSAEHRAGSGVAAGDMLDVTVEVDDAPRIVTLPDDLAAALGADPAARVLRHAVVHESEHVRDLGDRRQEAGDARRPSREVGRSPSQLPTAPLNDRPSALVIAVAQPPCTPYHV
jgi:hypothetical protein